jgi:hypothetical protein
MTVDERIHEVMVEVADEVRPAPDPYGRLHARRRRVRRRRAVAAGSSLVVAVAAAAAIVLTPGGGGGPTVDSDGNDPMRSINQWSEKVRTTPTRGELAAKDPAYATELARLVAEHQRAGAYMVKAPVTEVNVVFVDDVGNARLALVAFHLAKPGQAGWVNSNAWLVAPKGASPAELAAPESISSIGVGLDPFTIAQSMQNDDGFEFAAAVAVAPGGCVVESAPMPGIDRWAPEPTGSYLVRTTATERPEWWRVVCDGVVKEMQPAAPAGPVPFPEVSKSVVDAAIKGARGHADQRLADASVRNALSNNPNELRGPTRVLWGGQITGAKPDISGSWDGTAVLTETPWMPNGWQISLDIRRQSEASDFPISVTATQATLDDPTRPAALLPIRLNESESVVVVVPDGATTVRAVRGESIVDTADVTGLVAVVDAPDAPDLVFEALDDSGGVLATAKLPGTLPNPFPYVVDWW